jgi:hypothetical protein
MSPTQIQRHMDVVSSSDEPLGIVDHILGSNLQLAKTQTGRHGFVPFSWIAHIDDKIHLARSAAEVEGLWDTEPSPENDLSR